jgi:anti-sigma regulatory factor (Ser/Thr protein kinase)
MEINSEIEFYIKDESSVLYTRKKARAYCAALNFPIHDLDKLELIVSELGTNIFKYSKKGFIQLKKLNYHGIEGLEILASSEGSSIINLIDYINAKPVINLKESLKAGLSSIYNLSDEFEYIHNEKGNHFIVRKWKAFDKSNLRYSVVSRPKAGEWVNGDNFFIKQLPYYSLFSVIDGLGHGTDANIASTEAGNLLKIYYYKPLDELMNILHSFLRATRGVVVSICKVYTLENRIEYVGMGNVEMRMYNHPDNPRLYNYNGTVGLNIEQFQVMKFNYQRGVTFVMFSDGIKEFVLPPEIIRLNSQQIVSFIIDNYSKESDDATILVAR